LKEVGYFMVKCSVERYVYWQHFSTAKDFSATLLLKILKQSNFIADFYK